MTRVVSIVGPAYTTTGVAAVAVASGVINVIVLDFVFLATIACQGLNFGS